MGSLYTALQILICIISLLLCIQWPQVFAIDVFSEGGRKLLQGGIKLEADEKTTFPTIHANKDQHNHQFSFSAKIVAMAVPGLLILGCVLLWPCCQPKKKEFHSADSQRDLTASKWWFSYFCFESFDHWLSVKFSWVVFYLVDLSVTDSEFLSCGIFYMKVFIFGCTCVDSNLSIFWLCPLQVKKYNSIQQKAVKLNTLHKRDTRYQQISVLISKNQF